MSSFSSLAAGIQGWWNRKGGDLSRTDISDLCTGHALLVGICLRYIGGPWCPRFSRSAESGMQRRHGFHGVLPGDWSRHFKPYHPHRQLRDPAPGLSHLLHSVRLSWQRPFERIRVGAPGPTATVSHTACGDAKLPGVVPL